MEREKVSNNYFVSEEAPSISSPCSRTPLMTMALKCILKALDCTEKEAANDCHVVMGRVKRYYIGEIT